MPSIRATFPLFFGRQKRCIARITEKSTNNDNDNDNDNDYDGDNGDFDDNDAENDQKTYKYYDF